MRYVNNSVRLIKDAAIRLGEDEKNRPARLPALFLANGSFGGCIDRFGMTDDASGDTRTFLWHKKHMEKGTGGIECRLPLLKTRYKIFKDGTELPVTSETTADYSQTLDIFHAEAVTRFTLFSNGTAVCKITLKQFASLAETELFASRFEVEPLCGAVTLRYETEMLSEAVSHHSFHIDYPAEIIKRGKYSVMRSHTSGTDALAAPICGEDVSAVPPLTLCAEKRFDSAGAFEINTVCVCTRGDITIEKAIENAEKLSYDGHFALHCEKWERYWGESAVYTGIKRLDTILRRFSYALRSSTSDAEDIPLSPGGLTSTGLWPFVFPQDFLWIYESFFVSNHLGEASSTAGYWLDILPQVIDFTKKAAGVDGAFVPWALGGYDLSEMQRPADDPPFAWQLHNAAYPLHMIRLYWLFTGDDGYLRRMLPVAAAITDFYTGISSYNEKAGKYEITFRPCMGQDELGGFNKDNYLCCMLSAAYSLKYTLEMYEELGERPKALWSRIAEKGYYFDAVKKDGMLATYQGGPTPNPLQKHPSQLNCLSALPLKEVYNTPEFRETFRRRYEISRGAEGNYWIGWSLGTFLIACVRMRDKAACDKDFGMLLSNANAEKPQVDPEYIQCYETGGYSNGASYFHTVMGMIVSAVTQLFVQWHDGHCTVFPVILSASSGKRVCFDSLLTPFGYTVSGVYENTAAEVEISALRDTLADIHVANISGEYTLSDENGAVLCRSDSGIFTAGLKKGGKYFIRRI